MSFAGSKEIFRYLISHLINRLIKILNEFVIETMIYIYLIKWSNKIIIMEIKYSSLIRRFQLENHSDILISIEK